MNGSKIKNAKPLSSKPVRISCCKVIESSDYKYTKFLCKITNHLEHTAKKPLRSKVKIKNLKELSSIGQTARTVLYESKIVNPLDWELTMSDKRAILLDEVKPFVEEAYRKNIERLYSIETALEESPKSKGYSGRREECLFLRNLLEDLTGMTGKSFEGRAATGNYAKTFDCLREYIKSKSREGRERYKQFDQELEENQGCDFKRGRMIEHQYLENLFVILKSMTGIRIIGKSSHLFFDKTGTYKNTKDFVQRGQRRAREVNPHRVKLGLPMAICSNKKHAGIDPKITKRLRSEKKMILDYAETLIKKNADKSEHKRKEICRAVFNKYCAGRYDPPYIRSKQIENAIIKRKKDKEKKAKG